MQRRIPRPAESAALPIKHGAKQLPGPFQLDTAPVT